MKFVWTALRKRLNAGQEEVGVRNGAVMTGEANGEVPREFDHRRARVARLEVIDFADRFPTTYPSALPVRAREEARACRRFR